MRAEDADSGINGEIYYSIAEETDQFAIHPVSGVLTLTRPLVYRHETEKYFFLSWRIRICGSGSVGIRTNWCVCVIMLLADISICLSLWLVDACGKA